jgi:alpha-beta hydrolase superfamily lysophospholipase
MNEQTIVFGPDRNLIGTFTLPSRAAPEYAGAMALLTNAGVIPRIGPHRLNVKLARRLAELGIATLRFDLSGLGDSRRSSSRRTTGEQFIFDTRCAMDLAQAQFGAARFFMVGFCSGGDVAHVTALEDARLRAILMWDSYVYPTREAKVRGLLLRLRRACARSRWPSRCAGSHSARATSPVRRGRGYRTASRWPCSVPCCSRSHIGISG